MSSLLSFVDSPLAVASFVAGAVCYVGWPFCRSHRWMMMMQGGIGIGFGLHYALMGASTAAAANALSAAQIIATLLFGASSRSRWIPYVLFPATVAVCLFTWDGPHSLLATIGTLLIGFGRLQMNADRMRILVASGVPFWLVHDLAIMSPIAVFDAISLVTGMYGLWRQGLLRSVRVNAPPAGSTPYRRSLGV
ncbi:MULTISPECIES: YgjV family protein [unclassified Sinorhizobium]|uniref:YgjV family protein n=1 Tax=unclassified Sinorhizobium TaxID=2613772 RepID=UPI003523E156